MRVLGAAVKGGIVAGAGAGVERPLLPSEWLIEKEAEAEAIFVASCRREGSVVSSFDFYLVRMGSRRRTRPSEPELVI